MSKKTYPSREATSFVLAEDIRTEQNNKITFIGVYGGGRIVLYDKPTTEKPVKVGLVFFFAFQDGAGKYRSRVAIYGPDLKPIFPEAPLQDLEKEGDKALVTGLVARPMDVTSLGKYTAEIVLDDRAYQFPFILQLGSRPETTEQQAKKAKPRRKRSAKAKG